MTLFFLILFLQSNRSSVVWVLNRTVIYAICYTYEWCTTTKLFLLIAKFVWKLGSEGRHYASTTNARKGPSGSSTGRHTRVHLVSLEHLKFIPWTRICLPCKITAAICARVKKLDRQGVCVRSLLHLFRWPVFFTSSQSVPCSLSNSGKRRDNLNARIRLQSEWRKSVLTS